jgi:hypothetical protein
MADAVEATELFDVDMDDVARMRALIAADRLGRFQGVEPV